MIKRIIQITVIVAAMTFQGLATAQAPSDSLISVPAATTADSTGAVSGSIPEGYELIDSVIYRPAPKVDSIFVGKDIFQELPLVGKGGAADVRVRQSQEIADAMHAHFETNRSRTLTGYRVRIFFDNKRTSRVDSENALNVFTERYRDIAAYRSYSNPYFKVTVGDFRTKSEAMQLLRRIRHEFPSAFIVKENISYPVVDNKKQMIADTVRVLRQIPSEKIVVL